MAFTEYLGLIAGLFVTGSLIPQVYRVFRLKSAREISIFFTTLLLTGMLIWLVYGIVLALMPLILWNVVGAVLVSLLLTAKLKYGR